MNKSFRNLVIITLFAFVVLPVAVVAQTSGNYSNYRQQKDALQQKINALGGTADVALFMPILFGVGVKDISDNFGEMRPTGRPHAGEDIMAIKGTPIVSPTAAVVTLVTTDITSSQGNAVYTTNPGGEKFVYYHLSRIGEGVVSGLVLTQGALIGYVGDSGSAAGTPHLHLEIYNSAGVATDPFIRLTVEFTPEQKISFLTTILAQSSDPVALSQFLVANFRSTFSTDIQNGIALPSFIKEALTATPSLPQTAGNLPAGCLPGNNFSITTGRSCIVATGGAITSIARNLTVGMTGNDVKILQVWLNTHGYLVALSGPGSLGNETTIFGGLTRVALAKFQANVGISPAVGYFGPITRSYLSTH